MLCRICGNDKDNKDYYVKDYKFVRWNTFHYFQCAECECLQIAEIPGDMSVYYGSGYYSFEAPKKGLTNKLRVLRDSRLIKSGGGGGLAWLFPGQLISFLLKNKFLSKKDRILDVGCGAGKLLFSLKENGFDKVLGIDPFLTDTIRYKNGLTILKKTIHELEDGGFDLIMMNHSFEHMSDPLEVLVSAKRLLADDGVCLIRVPTVSSFSWEEYREKWLSLSAPEHFYIHSIKSMKYLAEKTGFCLDRVVYDSSVHQNLVQEQFIKENILPHDKRLFSAGIKNYILNFHRIVKYQKIAEELNKKNQGECCAFVLKKQR